MVRASSHRASPARKLARAGLVSRARHPPPRHEHRLSPDHKTGRWAWCGPRCKIQSRRRGCPRGRGDLQPLRQRRVQYPLRGIFPRDGPQEPPPRSANFDPPSAGHLRARSADGALGKRTQRGAHCPQEGALPRCRTRPLPPIRPYLRMGEGRRLGRGVSSISPKSNERNESPTSPNMPDSIWSNKATSSSITSRRM